MKRFSLVTSLVLVMEKTALAQNYLEWDGITLSNYSGREVLRTIGYSDYAIQQTFDSRTKSTSEELTRYEGVYVGRLPDGTAFEGTNEVQYWQCCF